MIVYSSKIIIFLKDIKLIVKNILLKEVHLKVKGDRFYDQLTQSSYPIKIVIFNNKSMLGYFEPDFYELGFNECLMNTSRFQLENVIRHELAHYMTFIKHNPIQAHGPEFRSFCKSIGWGEEIYKATTCLDIGGNSFKEESVVLRKIEKLMALATSNNQNEAEQAIIKSQQLLLKYNIESKYLGKDNEEKIFLKRIMKQKKENAKMRTIAHILETFFVNVVYTRGVDHIYLEILGSETNIEIAEYVANILDIKLDNLWNQVKNQANLKGMIAKNSFLLGIAKGYCNKVQALKKEYNKEVSNALMIIQKQVTNAKEMVYQRLSSKARRGYYCKQSSVLGEQMGRALNIHPAIKKASPFTALLGHFADS